MINKLTNQEIAKVLAMYWGQKFRYSGSIGVHRTVAGINRNWNIADDSNEGISYRVDKCQLLLSRLEDITDEDAAHIFELSVYPDAGDWEIRRLSTYVVGRKGNVNCYLWYDADLVLVDVSGEDMPCQNKAFIFQYLVNKGYAVPLYLGVRHWANGMDAIQLNIAIDAKTLAVEPNDGAMAD